jgi:hypothetical protein
VDPIRRLVLDHRALALFLVLVALLARLMAPAGFMPTMQDGTITISICTGNGPATMPLALPGTDDKTDHGGSPHQGEDHPCPFGSLAGHALGGADPVILAAALLLAFAAALFFRAPVLLTNPAYVRPPLRGPPPRR